MCSNRGDTKCPDVLVRIGNGYGFHNAPTFARSRIRRENLLSERNAPGAVRRATVRRQGYYNGFTNIYMSISIFQIRSTERTESRDDAR